MKNLIKKILKEETLANTLLDRIKQDGWNETAELVGGVENLLDIIGNNKENIVSYLISFYKNLHLERRGGDIVLMDGGLTLIRKSGFVGLAAFDDYLKHRFDKDAYELYNAYTIDLIKGLIDLFPDLYSEKVSMYKDSGMYRKYGTIYL
jgi:hypothetical protein